MHIYWGTATDFISNDIYYFNRFFPAVITHIDKSSYLTEVVYVEGNGEGQFELVELRTAPFFFDNVIQMFLKFDPSYQILVLAMMQFEVPLAGLTRIFQEYVLSCNGLPLSKIWSSSDMFNMFLSNTSRSVVNDRDPTSNSLLCECGGRYKKRNETNHKRTSLHKTWVRNNS